ncbi:MAG: dimethylsulfoniopropionate lyase [Alphaproteobacteria bacterium]|nr:dimethylsulfoniopropionate lyase [Alphaproteobacteria bacterium]NNF25395.1 dimethlysulfonioproprionate lyase DddL [Paracoccaceae bacterium]
MPQTSQIAEPDALPEPRLKDCPDWVYLLQEFRRVYHDGSAGGSKKIRSHRRRVREALSAAVDANPVLSPRAPQSKPVVAHLNRAFDMGARNMLSSFSRALTHVADKLHWEYGYARVPRSLEKKYAYCEVVGPQGPVRSDKLILGFVLFAPNTTYPQHSHRDIEESYISVAGEWSENDAAIYAPGSLILNHAGEEHRITTGETNPCLLAYAWIGPENRLAAPDMRFSKASKSRLQQGI